MRLGLIPRARDLRRSATAWNASQGVGGLDAYGTVRVMVDSLGTAKLGLVVIGRNEGGTASALSQIGAYPFRIVSMSIRDPLTAA